MNSIAIDATWGSVPEIPEEPARKLSHQCRVVRIPEIDKHPNADTLGIIRIDGYQLVVKLGDFEAGGLAVYIPPDSVVPVAQEFEFLWAGKGYTLDDDVPIKYRRVTVRKFRKEWSEGLLMQIPMWVRYDDHGQWREVNVGDDLAGVFSITHYEPPEPGTCLLKVQRSGRPKSLKGWWYWLLELLGFRPNGNIGGHNRRGPKNERKVYDIEAYKHYPSVFLPGEPVIVTEKIHGSNARYTFDNGEFFIGSRTMWKNPEASCVWCDAVKQHPSIEAWCREHPGYTLYGEVVPTQGDKYRYGCEPGQVKFFLFDIMDAEGNWLSSDEVQHVNEGIIIKGVSNGKE